ncbi:MAG: hypothetical protein J6K84_04275 [Oscillospiraceae bacterium]|nr:hypothetical protein [Oscillospiraceae bacterium]
MECIVHRWPMGFGEAHPHCTLCGSRLFGGEVYYRIQRERVCRDCLPLLARRVFAPYRCQVEEECL